MSSSPTKCIVAPVLCSCFTFIFILFPLYIVQPILDSKTEWNLFGVVFTLFVGITILIVVVKYIYSKYRVLQMMRKSRELVSKNPIVIVSTISHDYAITIAPSASSALAITSPELLSSLPPPKYEPPPAYNECVVTS